MSTKYASLIKDLRTKAGFSQALVAEKLDLSRQSYMAIEAGVRGMTLQEAEGLCGLYGISIEELSGSIAPNYEKYKQMILAYLQAGADWRGKVPKTKLAKLLYLADFSWYYEHEESMSGMPYRKIQYGPVPDLYFRALDELFESGKIDIEKDGDHLYVSLSGGGSNTALDTLQDDEVELIGKIATKWKNERTQAIVDFTHEQIPYKKCLINEIIPYELIRQEDLRNVY